MSLCANEMAPWTAQLPNPPFLNRAWSMVLRPALLFSFRTGQVKKGQANDNFREVIGWGCSSL